MGLIGTGMVLCRSALEYLLSLGLKVTKAINWSPALLHELIRKHKCSSSLLSDSLITRCKRTKPLCCAAVNQIRRLLVFLPSPLVHLCIFFAATWVYICVCLCVCLHVVLREAVLKMVTDSDIHIHEWVKGMTQGLALQIKKEKEKKGLVLVTKGLKLVCSGQLKLLVCDRENAFFNSESSVQSDSFCTARLNVWVDIHLRLSSQTFAVMTYGGVEDGAGVTRS